MSDTSWNDDPSRLLRVTDGFRLAEVDPGATPGYRDGKKSGENDLAHGTKQLDELQERLYAQSRVVPQSPSLLLVLQAMDTAGKGGIVRHVIGATDPQGVHLKAFKAPTEEERAHDFLWRVEKEVPGAGYIGVFDRSHYEDVLIGRVRSLAPPEEIERRYGAIVDFEKLLTDAGTRIVKVMLHISPDEQKKRLASRLDRPDKHWKYNPGDVDERKLWPDYMDAYQKVFERTSTPDAPWYVVPADRKWYARLAVQTLLIDALRDIDPQWPAADFDVEVEKARLAAT
ncbi:polyphosphate kinase 2 family protein [Microbacterium sp. bgisy203]|uniref:polyphosphate kinase 2 family protein n=1 Tax=Microbacterium sp. bgisy203 TaxID=3413799 RepID=UPI003D70BF92